MKQITIIFIILLLGISSANADGYPAEEAEHWEKVRQMEQLAERFKAETGFKGEVGHSTTTMRLHIYRGNFPGISFTADGDTTAFRQACEGIISKVLPNSKATSNQLTMSRISKSGRGYTTDYYQQVNGYRVEGAGYIMITFENGRKYFSISDNTVELPENSEAIISEEEAILIANVEHFGKSGIEVKPWKVVLAYTNGRIPNNDEFHLCYNLYMGTVVCVDAVTGEIRYTWRSDVLHSFYAQVKGDVYNYEYNSPNPSSLGYKPLGGVSVLTNNFTGDTDNNGNVTIVDSTLVGLSSVLEDSPYISVTVYPDTTNAKHADRYISSSTPVEIFYDDDICYTPNVYYHAHNQRNGLADIFNIQTDIPFGTIIVAGDTTMNTGGMFDPNYNRIHLSRPAGKLSHATRHELSHSFLYDVFMDYPFHINGCDDEAMEEAFAVYLPCTVVGEANCIYGDPIEITSIEGIINTHINNISSTFYGNATINESFYIKAYNRYPIASAWWSLRNNPYFPSNGQNNGVDTLLVNSLAQVKDDIPYNNAYRYKPRYFYNILMSRVDTDNRSWPFNDKQAAIDSVYSIRGFHFYPRVQSVASASVNTPLARESYNVLDSVYVHISNYPQNTYGQVFVVEDSDYLNVGDGGIAIPAPFEVNGNPVSRIFKTDGDGKWAGGIPFSKQLPQGNYDIIVNNMVNSTTPDNTLHLALKNDNIIDGVDGLNGSGFTKTGTGDIVVALDLSSSMLGYGDQLAQMVKALEQSMIDSERINVFGFTEGTASQGWIEDGITDLIGDESSFLEAGQIDSTYVIGVLNSIQIDGNTDLVLPFHHGASRLSNLGSICNRKNIILLSDGIHFVTPPHADFPGYQGNWTHTIGFIDTLITTVVVPDSISCYTICYGYSQVGLNQMLQFANRGNGAFFLAEDLSDLKLYINQLLCSIRGTAPVENSIRGIEPGVVQSHEIMVEPGASELRLVVIGKTGPGGGGVSFTLVSPSGMSFRSAENAGVRRIMNPESGIWTAFVANNSSSSTSYNIMGDTRSDISLSVSPPPVSHPIDQPLLISASLKNYRTPITNSSVTARLTKENWLIETPMYDDGNHHDGDSGDGIYANYLYPFAHGYDLVSEPGGICNLEVFADMPSVSARRSHVQQIYIESNNSTSYPINSRLLTRGWNWIGFPRLSDYDGGNTIPYASISLMPYLQQIISENGYANYDESGWHYNNFDYLNSQMGYKLLIHNTDQVPLYDWGAITDTTSVYSLQKDKWNWLTYPCFNEAYPEDALANVIDNIDYIMAQNWSMKKENGVWIKDIFSHRPVIKYGESILIFANEDADFSWNSPSEPPVIEAPLESHHFVFNGKPEYETLIIESANLASNKTIKEIGVFQNQECIGARCAEGFPLHVLAYSDTNREENFPLEIRALTSDDTEIILKTNEVWDEHGTEEASMLNPEILGFRHLSLREGDQIPTVLSMSKNYPNPFNPSTTINYAVPQAGKVKLEIYNLRGQKVKVLVNEQTLPGMYKAVWDGKDRNNRSVSSGIYFAKLEHNNKTKIQKMVLMK